MNLTMDIHLKYAAQLSRKWGPPLSLPDNLCHFSEEQIAFLLQQPDKGISIHKVIRKIEVPDQTFCGWEKKFVTNLWDCHQPRLVPQITLT